MTMPDLGALSASQFFLILVLVGVFDFATGVVAAIAGKTFDPMLVLDVLRTHILQRAIPLGVLFAIGQIGGVDALTKIAIVGLGLYVAETVLSSASNVTGLLPSSVSSTTTAG